LVYEADQDNAVVGIFATLWVSAVVFFVELSRSPRRAFFGGIVATPVVGILCIAAAVAADQFF
jgi:hypothetical protein